MKKEHLLQTLPRKMMEKKNLSFQQPPEPTMFGLSTSRQIRDELLRSVSEPQPLILLSTWPRHEDFSKALEMLG